MIKCDFHMHSEFSSDSEAKMEDMIERAIAKGLEEICFTDHMDYDFPPIVKDKHDDSKYLTFEFDPKPYYEKLVSLQRQYESKIKIRIGVELGLQPNITPQVKQLMNSYDFDFCIGSTHLLYKDDPYYASFWQRLGYDESACDSTLNRNLIRNAIRDYLIEIDQNVDRFTEFQIYGHLDYITRYAPGEGNYYQVDEHMEVIEEILRKLIQTGRGIELNTSGYKNGRNLPNPHPKILKRYHELGGEILTIGADAHTQDYVAYEFQRAEELLQHCGFQYYTTFHKKQPIFHKL